MAIQDNVSIIQTSQGSGGGGECNLNIFTQLEEPEIKEGVWVQTNQSYQSITTVPNILNENGKWESVMTDLPYAFCQGSALVYNGEIYIFGDGYNWQSESMHNGSYQIIRGGTEFYKWDGTTWTNLGMLPYRFQLGSAVVYNGEIHLLGGSGEYDSVDYSGYISSVNRMYFYKYHYKWNGYTWENVSTIPYTHTKGSAVVYNGEIHTFFGTVHYKWSGSTWTSVSTLPYSLQGTGSAVVYNGEIHLLGGSGSKTYHYKWDGTNWTSVGLLPYRFYEGSTVVYNGEIHLLGGTGSKTSHYKWDGTSWSSVSTLPYEFINGSAVVYNGENIYILGSDSNRRSYSVFTSLVNRFNPYTLIIQRGNTSSGVYQTCFSDTFSKIEGEINRFTSNFDDIWYFLETKLDTSSPVYYGDGTKWIKLKN